MYIYMKKRCLSSQPNYCIEKKKNQETENAANTRAWERLRETSNGYVRIKLVLYSYEQFIIHALKWWDECTAIILANDDSDNV